MKGGIASPSMTATAWKRSGAPSAPRVNTIPQVTRQPTIPSSRSALFSVIGSKVASLFGQEEESDDQRETEQTSDSGMTAPLVIGRLPKPGTGLPDEGSDRDSRGKATGDRWEI